MAKGREKTGRKIGNTKDDLVHTSIRDGEQGT